MAKTEESLRSINLLMTAAKYMTVLISHTLNMFILVPIKFSRAKMAKMSVWVLA